MGNPETFNQEIIKAFHLTAKEVSIVPVSRASLGLVAVLRNWKENFSGYLVAIPGAICHDVVAAVLEAGCYPFFCDVDPCTGIVKEDEWIRARKNGVRAAIAVHLYGNVADVERVREIFPSPEYLLIDDAAQAIGSKVGNKPVGSDGDVGLVSFGNTKQISVGGAALIIRNSDYARRIETDLSTIHFIPEETRNEVTIRFRKKLNIARKYLRDNGDHSKFIGLLKSYEAALYPEISERNLEKIIAALQTLPDLVYQRTQKLILWNTLLSNTGLVPVGMGEGVSPWRYTCRLPGITWSEQYLLGESMRAEGLDVSHWYLPANWLLEDSSLVTLRGVEQLAREVFQFWVDEFTSNEDILKGAEIVCKVINQFGCNRSH